METSRGAVCHGYHKGNRTPGRMDIKSCYLWGEAISVIVMVTNYSALNRFQAQFCALETYEDAWQRHEVNATHLPVIQLRKWTEVTHFSQGCPSLKRRSCKESILVSGTIAFVLHSALPLKPWGLGPHDSSGKILIGFTLSPVRLLGDNNICYM